MRLIKAIEEHARRTPQKTALSDGTRTLTYGELLNEAARMAAKLKSADCQRLAIAGDNGIEWIVADIAALSMDIPVVPLPVFFTDAQRASVLASSGVTHIALSGALVPTAVQALPPLPAGTSKITYTSGSTGAPKGVCLPQSGLEAVAEGIGEFLGAAYAGRHICVLPLGVLLENVAGVYTALMTGASVFVPPLGAIGFQNLFRPDFGALLRGMVEAGATSVILVPELLRGLMAAVQKFALMPQALSFAAVGGAKVAPELLAQARLLGLPVYEGYGLSECGSVVAMNTPAQHRAGSAGRLLPHVRAHVSGGEIVVDNPCFLGYLGETPRGGAAFATGDLGAIDAGGFVTLQGRRKNLIITGFGRNISPEWVESELLAQPQIGQAVVYGEGAASLKALLVPAAEGADLKAAVAAANKNLPEYAQVTDLREIPRLRAEDGFMTGNGRIRRDMVLQHFCQGEKT